MDKLGYRYKQLMDALATLEEAKTAFAVLQKEGKSRSPHRTYEQEYRTYRDSLIQRFEYTTDLFWKYLLLNLEINNVVLSLKTPSEVIRECYAARMITEDEAQTALAMIKNRNKTSHIYIEEIAEDLAKKIPDFYTVLVNIVDRLHRKK